MKLDLYQPSGACNFDVALRILTNLCNPVRRVASDDIFKSTSLINIFHDGIHVPRTKTTKPPENWFTTWGKLVTG